MDRHGSHPVFYVRDNGVGIDPEYHEKIFGRFKRLETTGHGGGLGLALVKRTIESHGARIWVESMGRGRGSTLFFRCRRSTGPNDGVERST